MFNRNVDVSIVVPVFNEEEVIGKFFERVRDLFEKADVHYEIIFVDDGSRDRTFELLKGFKQQRSDRVRIVRFARNFGHQLAITAGMREAQGKAVVVTDSDLQDPPEVILEFIKKWKEGYETVYGFRTERQGETIFKKMTASLFYKLIRKMTNIDIPENAGDFYLLDRKVVDVLNSMAETHRFIRGLIVWVGFKRVGVPYKREARAAGYTKFSLWKMMKFSMDAATSFSFAPLRAITFLGMLISVVSFFGILWVIYVKLFTDHSVLGWASLMTAILFIGGVQLMAIGLIGEYLARIGDDVKRRPLYTIQEIL